MALKWDIDHMEMGYYVGQNGEVLEVKNVFLDNGKIDLSKIQIGDEIYSTENFDNYFDYNTSFDDIQFNNNEQDDIMKSCLKELAQVKELDTSYFKSWTNKDGTKQIKKYERKTSLEGTFFFYHNNTKEHPHFHISLPKKIPTGKDMKKLRNAINPVFSKYNIIPNNELEVEKNQSKNGKYEIRKFQEIKKRLEKVSWLYRQAESKVVNSKMSIKNYLDSKTEIVKDEKGNQVKIYKSNRCFFTLERDESFEMDRLMVRGINKGKVEKIKVHSLNELIEKYSNFSNKGGSKLFLESTIDRIEKIEKIELDRSVLQKYKTVDFNNSLEVLKNLFNSIEKGEKISVDYKNFWRKNKDSKNLEKRELAKQIQEMYAERKNNIQEYNGDRLLEKFQKGTQNIEKIIEKEKIRIESLKYLDKFLDTEKESDTNLSFKIKESLKKQFDIDKVYIKIDEGIQYLFVDRQKIDITEILEKYSRERNIKFTSTYRVIKKNKENRTVFEYYKAEKDMYYYVEKIEKDGKIEVRGDIDKEIKKPYYYDTIKEATLDRYKNGFELIKKEKIENGKLKEIKIYTEEEKNSFYSEFLEIERRIRERERARERERGFDR